MNNECVRATFASLMWRSREARPSLRVLPESLFVGGRPRTCLKSDRSVAIRLNFGLSKNDHFFGRYRSRRRSKKWKSNSDIFCHPILDPFRSRNCHYTTQFLVSKLLNLDLAKFGRMWQDPAESAGVDFGTLFGVETAIILRNFRWPNCSIPAGRVRPAVMVP